mmetsp:Transcript_10691/g.10606  ORF Transcript_10691/g.10606 Transcript_10691/m.10606 type:complete len:151 (-) Transcript_10691:26-478(-)
MYQNPPAAIALAEGQDIPDEQADAAQEHFEAFYEEVFLELANYGEIEDLAVVDNIGDHMIGNVYVKYVKEESSEMCIQKLTGRFYAGRIIQPEYSPVPRLHDSTGQSWRDVPRKSAFHDHGPGLDRHGHDHDDRGHHDGDDGYGVHDHDS